MTTDASKGEGAAKKKSNDSPTPFESALTEGRQRFLAHVIEHGLDYGRRSPEDFIRHFPPAAIMQGLKAQPQLRANILVIATGVRSKIALKKSAESCGSDLQIALDEGETDAETIVTLFDPDDRVRYLDARAIWSYVTEGSFWKAERKDADAHAVAADHVAYMLDRALKDRLVTHKDIVDGITVGKLAELLPRGELEKIITAALSVGGANKPYVEANLLGACPANKLVQYVPLSWIWEHVVGPRIAEKHGFVAPTEKPKEPEAEPAPAAEVAAEVADDPAPPTEIEATAEPSPSGEDLDVDVDDILGSSTKKPAPKVPRPPGRP